MTIPLSSFARLSHPMPERTSNVSGLSPLVDLQALGLSLVIVSALQLAMHTKLQSKSISFIADALFVVMSKINLYRKCFLYSLGQFHHTIYQLINTDKIYWDVQVNSFFLFKLNQSVHSDQSRQPLASSSDTCLNQCNYTRKLVYILI